MTDVLEHPIRVRVLRDAVRAQRQAGVSGRAISMLIAAFAAPADGQVRHDGGVPRLPIETIPEQRRAEFLVALCAMQDRVAVVGKPRR